ncbi:NAD(P)/FAD-dependent oxidoreductase [Consotaella aegiceratis]|uniref:NAD(P)/FAD-dependent oxidoreductase n=1 Tax=Consotaella aegiceratis TaxID=3097961 RepID=UPI002F3FEB4C
MSESRYQSPISPGRSWYEDDLAVRPTYPALRDRLDVDVLVVGGGFTGLSAAYHLARSGVSVALAEAHRCGDGASGRNGGQIGTGPRLWPSELEPLVGYERAKALFDLAEDAKADLFSFARAHDIDMDYRAGQLSVVHKRRYLKAYHEQAETLATRYFYPHATIMDAEETAARLGSRAYWGGLRDTGTGHIDPLKLVVGLARAAKAAGARLFEATPVTSFTRESGRIVAATPAGQISAERVLLVTNAHGGHLDRRLAAHIAPIGSFIGATAPLDDPDAILPGGESVDDSRFVVRYFRKSADNRLLFGGRETYHSAGSDGRQLIARQIASVYPQLAHVPLTHVWGGFVAITLRRLPFVHDVAPGVTAIAGYSGHGVALAPFAGRLYAERVVGHGRRLAQLEALDIPPFPGGRVLRTPLLSLAMTWFSIRDRV